MKKNYSVPSVPTANVAVNKSRLKLYTSGVEMPTYYLQKGQEFQIELFNPTSDVLLAKIQLNGKALSQGGLVLNPSERVFLDRYLDVAKKFLFDTYTVANTEAVKQAIEANGDIKVEFYKERQPVYNLPIVQPTLDFTWRPHIYYNGTDPNFLRGGTTTTLGGNVNISSSISDNANAINNIKTSSANYASGQNEMMFNAKAAVSDFTAPVFTSSYATTSNSVTTDGFLDLGEPVTMKANSAKRSLRGRLEKKSKTIETGRVEAGSESAQKFKYVSKQFDYFPFHTIEYKLLPVSQKINTTQDLNVKVYCTNCGAKLGKTDKFCASCGTKA